MSKLLPFDDLLIATFQEQLNSPLKINLFDDLLIATFQEQLNSPLKINLTEEGKLGINQSFQTSPIITMNKKRSNDDWSIDKRVTKSCKVESKTPPKPVTKEEILGFFNDILGTTLSYKVLVDISYNSEAVGEVHIVGRENVKGSSKKQMRHIIPHSFVAKLIQNKVKNSLKTDVFFKLSGIIKSFLNKSNGFCLNEEDLSTQAYQEINTYITEHPESITKKLVVNNDKTSSFLLSSPKRGGSIFSTPTKKEKAKEDFVKGDKIFVQAALSKLNLALTDQTIAVVASEVLSRYILTLFNQQELIAFPEEGNTLSYEIRLYSDKQSAKNPKNQTYEVLTSREIKDKIDKKIDLDSLIRIVNCEGSDAKKAWDALSELNSIITNTNLLKNQNNINGIVDNFNNKYNLKLKLANVTTDLNKYNDDLKNDSYPNFLEYKIAKLLYYSFDFKALENYVFCPKMKENSVKVYSSTSGDKTSQYNILNGAEYRAKKINEASGYNSKVIFRSENSNQELPIIVKKATQHINIALATFSGFSKGIKETPKQNSTFSQKIISAFSELVSLDYQLTDNPIDQLISNNSNEIYHTSELVGALNNCSIEINGASYGFLS